MKVAGGSSERFSGARVYVGSFNDSFDSAISTWRCALDVVRVSRRAVGDCAQGAVERNILLDSPDGPPQNNVAIRAEIVGNKLVDPHSDQGKRLDFTHVDGLVSTLRDPTCVVWLAHEAKQAS